MGRVRRDGGLPKKGDTPVKPTLAFRNKQKRPQKRKCDVIPEEPDEDGTGVTSKPTDQVRTSSKPALRLSSRAFTDNLKYRATSPSTPANTKHGHQVSPGLPDAQVTPDPEALPGGERPDEEEQNLALTPESIMASGVDLDATFSSDDDDDDDDSDDDDSSSASMASSPPSPEIFRQENYVEMLSFPFEEDVMGPHIKNSTLLNVSHAESIHRHQPPNVSTIIDTSTSFADKKVENSKLGGIVVEPKMISDSIQAGNAFEKKTQTKSAIRKPIFYKKKVWFKSPVITEQIYLNADTSGAGRISFNDKMLKLAVTLENPVKANPEQGKFFDFNSKTERDEFFQRARERCVRLRSYTLFPLSVAKHIAPSFS